MREFRNLADANRQLAEWITGEAGNRIHGTTRRRPLDLFAETEKPLLAVHCRLRGIGRRSTLDEHMPPEALAYKLRDPQWCLKQAEAIGPACHLAQALGHAAVRQGYDVTFTTQTQLLGSLAAARAIGTYERRFQALAECRSSLSMTSASSPCAHPRMRTSTVSSANGMNRRLPWWPAISISQNGRHPDLGRFCHDTSS